LPISFFVFNDRSLGNVRDVLSRKGRDLANFSDTKFAEIAKAMKIKGIRINKYTDLREGISKGINSKEPMLVDIFIDPKASHLNIRRS
jgi:thiamine pyrophosphate-dependent acetolactate synthase large subunit-like protein